MNRSPSIVLVFILFAFLLTSCEVIGGIFKAGVFTGIFVVVLVIALIIFAIVKMGKKD